MNAANRALRSQGTPDLNADASRIASRLGTFELFRDADRGDLLTIAASGVELSAPAGWSLIWAKTPADKAYVILSGEVDIKLTDGRTVRLGAGDVVGEKAILEHKLRTATVVAATPLEVLHFTADAVTRLYADVPAFRAALDTTLAKHAA
ncbi:cyclic nucleotide-binding domain-containing protein [Nocardioides jiangxiensis]|uniref:Cyclic nucleotide-binding domain-containing protein n=1 Tax=Nocardioides jiangxiensis TaxID=3064524 RepID=A0ABT9B0P7_9ACTN|nr:cyclic nucleotide-binding domain-containing protein [Nocardioides sp. WY-20]MDO7867975.1 cyclic nucleotide-binding domain-containing protein [Nocardioides sp. WY-20]